MSTATQSADARMIDDNFEMPEFVNGGQSADQIQEENTYSSPAPGEHVFEVLSYEPPTLNMTSVLINDGGRMVPDLFESHSVKLRFCLPGKPRCTIDDFFTLPPAQERARVLYLDGEVVDKDGGKSWGGPGREAKKLVHFLNALGFDVPPNKPLPKECLRLANWKGLRVIATVGPQTQRKDKAGNPMVDDSGRPVMGYARLKMFSYRRAEGGAAAAGAALAAGDGGRPAPAPTPAIAPAKKVSLDNL